MSNTGVQRFVHTRGRTTVKLLICIPLLPHSLLSFNTHSVTGCPLPYRDSVPAFGHHFVRPLFARQWYNQTTTINKQTQAKQCSWLIYANYCTLRQAFNAFKACQSMTLFMKRVLEMSWIILGVLRPEQNIAALILSPLYSAVSSSSSPQHHHVLASFILIFYVITTRTVAHGLIKCNKNVYYWQALGDVWVYKKQNIIPPWSFPDKRI